MTTMFQVSYKAAYTIAVDYLQAGLVPNLTSSPGLGKSALARQIATDFNLQLIDIRLSQTTPEDLMGLPMRDSDGRAYFAPFKIFPLASDPLPAGKDGWLLFLDEFNSASKMVQAAAYKLILDHYVGMEKLHPQCLTMCAGNLASDRAIVTQSSTAMQSRLAHIELEHNPAEFAEHMIKADFDYRVRGFIDFLPAYGHNFNPDHQDRTFSCPRTLEFLSNYVKNKKAEDISVAACSGIVSDGVAVEFVQYIKEYANLPSYGQIVSAPKTIAVPSKAASCFAVLSMLIDKYDRTDFDAIADFISRFSPEFQIPYYRGVKVRDPALLKDPKYKARIAHLTRFLTDSELDAVA